MRSRPRWGVRRVEIGGITRYLELYETYEYRQDARDKAAILRRSGRFEFVRVINRSRWKPLVFEFNGETRHSADYGIYVL